MPNRVPPSPISDPNFLKVVSGEVDAATVEVMEAAVCMKEADEASSNLKASHTLNLLV